MKNAKRIGWVPWCVEAPDGRPQDLGPWISCGDESRVEAEANGKSSYGHRFVVVALYAKPPKVSK